MTRLRVRYRCCLALLIATHVVSMVACEGGDATTSEPPPLPEPTVEDPASRLAIVDIPYRFETPQAADEGSVVLTQGATGFTYELIGLDGGVIELAPPSDEANQRLFVTPLGRYRVDVSGPACQSTFAFRARSVGEVLDLGGVGCGAQDQVSDEPGQPVPFLNFDVSDDRGTLALHDGARLFLIDADGNRDVADAVPGGPPRWVGDSIFYPTAGGTGIHDVTADATSEIPMPYASFIAASEAGKTALFDQDGGGLLVFSWADAVEQVWSSAIPVVVGESGLDPSGTRVAYFATTNQTTYVQNLNDPGDQVSFGQEPGRVVFALDGSGELLVDGSVVSSPSTGLNGEAFDVAGGTAKLMIAAASGLSVYETGTQMLRGVDIALAGDIVRAQAVGDKMVIRIDETTQVIDVETETIIATFEGRWRPWRLSPDQLLLITLWDVPVAGQIDPYPACSPPNTSCEGVVIDASGAQVWTGEVSTGVPFGAALEPRFGQAGPRDDEGCIPVDLYDPKGDVVPTEGDFCHVQSMPDLFFGIPCLPHAVTASAGQGVYCAY